MHKLLIVDDEIYAVEAVQAGLDWSSLGIGEVLCAYDADEAKNILQDVPVEVMICDIEMPGCTGVELLEWVNERSPATVTIFLTGHADFAYAQQAIRLGGFDYLLKPVKYGELQTVVQRALTEIERAKETERFGEWYRTYSRLSETQKPLLNELFWQDLLSRRIQADSERLPELLQKYQVGSLQPDMLVLPVLVSVDQWCRELSENDERILEFALRNAASELLLPPGIPGDVIEDRGGIMFGMLYLKHSAQLSRKLLHDACKRYIEGCSRYFYCTLSCYIGKAVPIAGVVEVYHRLIELEHANIAETGVVLEWDDGEHPAATARKMNAFSLDASEWIHHLESGRADTVVQQIEKWFGCDGAGGMSSEALEALYHMVMGFVYQVVHQKGGSVKQLIGGAKRTDAAAAIRSVPQLLAWSRKIIDLTAGYLQRNRTECSALIEKVKAYVDAHLQTVTREEIASAVYLNSAYLSRLFKRETGQSLMDYIIAEKINRAKLMLTESNIRIGDICDFLGYENMSHFSKTFKRQVGITPQEFRKRYQAIV